MQHGEVIDVDAYYFLNHSLYQKKGITSNRTISFYEI